MFYVIELQTTTDESGAGILTSHKTRNEALSKYHNVLQYAAVSEVPVHAAVCVDEEGNLIAREAFDHRNKPVEAEA